MKNQNIKCCNCNSIFTSTYYNWYYYYSKGKFHECPECKSKLVPTYDFERTGILDKITVRLFSLAVASGALAGYFWGYNTVGTLVFAVPAVIGGITHAMYWYSLIGADKELQDTRILDSK